MRRTGPGKEGEEGEGDTGPRESLGRRGLQKPSEEGISRKWSTVSQASERSRREGQAGVLDRTAGRSWGPCRGQRYREC